MTNKVEKIKKVILAPRKLQDQKANAEIYDEAYRQINQISFQENFKVLIGHYKNESAIYTPNIN